MCTKEKYITSLRTEYRRKVRTQNYVLLSRSGSFVIHYVLLFFHFLRNIMIFYLLSINQPSMRTQQQWIRRTFYYALLTSLITIILLLEKQQGISIQLLATKRGTDRRIAMNILQMQQQSQRGVFDSKVTSNPLGLYVHIPYCRRRCNYCNFAIVPIGGAPEKNTKFHEVDALYRLAILKELDMNTKYMHQAKLQTIYLGGGTPSLAPIETIQKIMHAIRKTFSVEKNAEITIEMDPGTFDKEYLQLVTNSCGFNRVSLGVQSFDDAILRLMGRQHTVTDIYQSFKLLKEVGVEQISIDLICGEVPGLTCAQWASTLEKAANLNPTHMSVYDLQLEKGTTFDKWYSLETTAATTNRPTQEDCAFMYKYASGYLRSRGYEHYEISSYAALPHSETNHDSPNRSRHNSMYWEPNSQWLALGLGATSCFGNKHFQRPRQMADYIAFINSLSLHSNSDVERDEISANTSCTLLPWFPSKWLTEQGDTAANENFNRFTELGEEEKDAFGNILMTRLRTSDGLDLDWIRRIYGEQMVNRILDSARMALDLNLAKVVSGGEAKDGTLCLIGPDGFLFSNTIISSIFVELGLE